MKMFYCFVTLVVAAVTLASCNSVGGADTGNKMTKAEEQRLVELARIFILKNKKITTREERYFVKTNQPKVSVIYEGYKLGKAVILWDTGEGKRKIGARLDGAMTGDNYQWGIITYFEPKMIISPLAKERMRPIQVKKVKSSSVNR